MLKTEKKKCEGAFLNHQWVCAVCQYCSGIFEKAAHKGNTMALKNSLCPSMRLAAKHPTPFTNMQLLCKDGFVINKLLL